MTIDVEIISREIIRPATSIPDHLHHYKFSLFDQLISSAQRISLIYFYCLDDHKLSNNEKASHLKTSLSQVLNHYYPLTGVIKDNYSLHCKDGGVLVQEAQVNCQLQEILQSSHPAKFFNKLLPDSLNDSVFTVQVNFFNCGGIGIGAVISHKIADGLSLITFIKKWADTARGDGENVCPKFECATLLPPKLDIIDPSESQTRENVVIKRFVFTNSNIFALKEKYVLTSSTGNIKTYPSRFEALTSFLFSRIVTSTKKSTGPQQSYGLGTSVNCRKRIDPPLSDDHFGNLAGPALSIISSQNDTEEEIYSHGIVNELKELISEYDKNISKMLNHEDIINSRNEVLKTYDIRELVCFYFASFCWFPVYETDFGWGKPMWVAPYSGLSAKNAICFMDTRNGDGIEAWIHLTDEDMAIFESDKELLTYASPTPCP